MHRTKIVATIGPASNDLETIRKMLHAGMNVARINFSHGSHESHSKTVETLRKVAQQEGKVLAILGDLQGPKLRLGMFEPFPVKIGQELLLSHKPSPGVTPMPHPELIENIRPGARIVIGDGEIEFRAIAMDGDIIRCEVVVGGLLEPRKGINAPGTNIVKSCITPKDRRDLALICKLDFDYVALSFVRQAHEVNELHDLIAAHGKRIPIIAKIEKCEAIEDLHAIRDAADGLMVARGDLGIDMPPQQVPILQKHIISSCNEVGKPVITATQMLQSMIVNPRPTRAEASDVANAILDGTDAVMLSAETAAGNYPVEAVAMMRQISEITEAEFPYDLWRSRRYQKAHRLSITEAICSASCSVSERVDVKAIVSSTSTGYTARQIARHRPAARIWAVTPSPVTQRRLALVWGVESLLSVEESETDEVLAQTVNVMREPLQLVPGDRIVIAAGIPFGRSGQTNFIKVHEVLT